MAANPPSVERVSTYCALCVSRCGAIATVEGGRFVRLDPDPSHPTGSALCAKGRAAPELVYHRDRLRYPRARARLNDTLQPDVACGQHGWWQPCPDVGAPGYDPFGPEGANYNLLIGNAAIDPISGSVPQRAYLYEIRLAARHSTD